MANEFEKYRIEAQKEEKGRLEPPLAQYRTLLSSADTAHGPAFPALESIVMSVPAVNVGWIFQSSRSLTMKMMI